MPVKKKAKVVKDSAWYSMIGKKGGKNNKKKQLKKNPHYFEEIGLRGGLTMKNTRGSKFYSDIGKIGVKVDKNGQRVEKEAK